MPIKRLEDIEREKHEEKREKLKQRITEDTKDVLEGVFGKPKKRSLFGKILRFILIAILLITIINLVLGNIWLLKFFWGEFF